MQADNAPIAHTWLFNFILDHFNLEELKTLCFELGVHYDDLPGDERRGKTRELILYLERSHKIDMLRTRLEVLYPDAYQAAYDASAPEAQLDLEVIPELANYLPPGSCMDQAHNARFTGRVTALRKLARHLLDPSRPTAIANISGIPGVGKTELAVEFALRYGPRFAGGVFWIDCADEVSIVDKIGQCAAALAGTLQIETQPSDVRAAFVRREWTQRERPLIIFDNCEDPGALEQWRPKTGTWRLIITSRNTSWPTELEILPLRLEKMGIRESVQLLACYLSISRYPGLPTDPRTLAAEHADLEARLRAIAAELGHLPLALRLAGSYLNDQRGVSLDEYLRLLGQPGLLEHESMEWFDTRRGTRRHVGRTFALSYDKLQPQYNLIDRLAVGLLARAACFAPGEAIPADLLFATVSERATAKASALRRLRDLGLIEVEEGATSAEDVVRMHQLLARFVNEAGVDDTARSAVEDAVLTVGRTLADKDDARPLGTWLVHLRRLTAAAADRMDKRAAALYVLLGELLYQSGAYAAAESAFAQACAILEATPDAEPAELVECLNDLGAALSEQGRTDEARDAYTRALTLSERALGPDHAHTLGALSNLGELEHGLRNLDAAAGYYERALDAARLALGNDDMITAAVLHNSGMLQRDLGDPEAARAFLSEALAIRERLLPPDHSHTLLTRYWLARTLLDLGERDAARDQLTAALQVSRARHGDDDDLTRAIEKYLSWE